MEQFKFCPPGVGKSQVMMDSLFTEGDLAVVMKSTKDTRLSPTIYSEQIEKIYDDIKVAQAVTEVLRDQVTEDDFVDIDYFIVIYAGHDSGGSWG